jgi:uncharacterized protein
MRKLILPVLLAGALLSYHQGLTQSYIPEKDDAKMKIKPVVPIKSYAFNLKDVTLLQSPFTDAMKADERYLLLLEPDRLLADFRLHSGLPAKAKRYGGWESSGLAGHSLGHYLSACAMQYASTGNAEFLKRVNYVVDELDICQQARKTGYIGAIPKEDTVWAEVSQGNIRSRGFDLNGAWSPWYTVHKIMAGLIDAYLYADNAKALKIEVGMSDWTGETIKNLSDEQMQKMLLCEYGGMNDVLVNTYAITGNKKYLDLSYRFHDRVILDSLANKKDILPGKHSNTQIPKLIGTARRYQLTGNEKDLAASEFFWKVITHDHSYAPGGNSNYEYLSEPGKLNNTLTENTMETCNTYNMLKLTRHLFSLNPSAKLMDYYEKGLYNHILASQNDSTGMMCYFVPLRMGSKKQFSNEFDSFTCCVGSGMENHVKYGESIYFKGADGSLYINLFIPSVLNWREKGITLKQETNLPASDIVRYTITALRPLSFPLKIRKPHWATSIALKVNGKPVAAIADESGYLVINRRWKTNDIIELTMPSSVYSVSMPDNPNRKAIFYGPVVLAGMLGIKEPDPVNGIPVFVSADSNASNWIVPVDKSKLIFKSVSNTGVPADIKLAPFHEVDNEHYSVYWDVFSPSEWAIQQQLYEEKKKKEKELEIRTVDVLRPGEMQPERDHNFAGENTETGEDHTRKFRVAHQGGSLIFAMNVDHKASNTLINTYWGMDNRGRTFDIFIDDVKIATQDLNKLKESRFYDISYSIPLEITKGKKSVVVKIQAINKNNSAGPLYGSRMVKE